MKFYKPFDSVPFTPEKSSGKTLVEKAGYIPTHKLIQNMMEAGERLNAARAEMYDTYDPNADLDVDPTRDRGLDLAEATELSRDVKSRIDRIQANRRAKAKEVSTEPPKPPSVPPAQQETPK